MDYQKSINEIIEQALTEKTFSLDIINKIKELRDNVISLTEELEGKKKSYEELSEQNSQMKEELDEANARLLKIEERERKVEQEEKKQAELNLRLEFHSQRADEIKELFGLVFRNPVILKSKLVGHTHMPQGGSYPSSTQTNDTEKEEIA